MVNGALPRLLRLFVEFFTDSLFKIVQKNFIPETKVPCLL